MDIALPETRKLAAWVGRNLLIQNIFGLFANLPQTNTGHKSPMVLLVPF